MRIKMENKFKDFMNDEEWNERLSSLTKKQLLYFQIMLPKTGVLNLQSKPGIGKSATGRAIAKKMNMRYLDLRLSMVDETDVGLYPEVGEVETTKLDGETEMMKVLSHVVPEWAVIANDKPTLIHFEELNRASLPVRNAALQLLLEREIGIKFKFNENVLMMASGNLGEEDGTDVEEFDSALNNRLIHYNHSLSFDEWVEDFAKYNINPTIINFLKANPEKLYVNPTENTPAYATPRSWTFLSNFIFTNFGHYAKDKNGESILDDRGNPQKKYGLAEDWIETIQTVGRSYLGDTITRFVRYCEDNLSISILDILNDYPKHKKAINEFNRDRKSELLINLREMDIEKFTKKQIKNAVTFINTIDADERTGYLLEILDENDVNLDKTKSFLMNFKDDLTKLDAQHQTQSSEK